MSSLQVRAESSTRSRRKYPERSRARNVVQRAIKAGRLTRPDACQRCGTACKPEASHDDYDQPLLVEWLCRPCHAKKDLATHCVNGHEFTPENTYFRPNGWRVCQTCRKRNDREWSLRKEARNGN
jgi:hypothetical protein